MKELIKKAMDLAENEVQDKEIQNLKNIIKNLLQKKKIYEKEKEDADEKIKLIKQDIDDFKAGRLDKIKERHDLTPKASEISPINVIIINDNKREVYPRQPWLWNYEVVWGHYPTILTGSAMTYGTSGGNIATLCGTTSANFTGGTYAVSANGVTSVINL